MRTLNFLIILQIAASSLAQTQSVNLQSTSTQSYCKGCSPQPDEYERLYTPKPFPSELYFYSLEKDEFGKQTKFMSGQIQNIKLGSYVVSFQNDLSSIEINQIIKNSITPVRQIDSRLLNAYQVTISIETTEVTVNHHSYCPWQLNPDIPPPPSTNRGFEN